MTEPIPIDQLTFGVELEVIMPDTSNGDRGRSALANRMVEADVVCAHEAYNHRTRPHWKIVTDGSIGSDNAEIVSPILRGQDGFDQVRKVCLALDAHGCRVNRTTGFHVHVGARDRFAEQIGFFKELVRTHAKFEPVIDQLVSRSRRGRNSQWCQPTEFSDAVDRATTIDRVIREANPNGRYAKLNLTAYHSHGTVEFRQHQGTTNAQKIENWVKLCLRMVAHAARNTERAGSSGEFVPPAMPLLPVPPRFADGERDLSQAVPLRRAGIPRFSRNNSWNLRHLTLMSVAVNHHRPDTEAHRMLESCRYPGENLDQLRRRGVSRSWLGFFADRGELVIVSPGSAPTITADAGEQTRRTAEIAEHAATVQRMRSEHEATVAAARAAWEAGRGSAGVVSRPPTDSAPATLEGLLSLVSAVESERAYFTERQMELN
jgi:hypothetical protein